MQDGKTPLMLAISKNHSDLARLMLTMDADVDARDEVRKDIPYSCVECSLKVNDNLFVEWPHSIDISCNS